MAIIDGDMPHSNQVIFIYEANCAGMKVEPQCKSGMLGCDQNYFHPTRRTQLDKESLRGRPTYFGLGYYLFSK